MENKTSNVLSNNSIYDKLYFWWLLITTGHSLLLIFTQNFIVRFIGLFVPFGDFKRLLLASTPGKIIFDFIITLIFISVSTLLLNKFKGSRNLKIVFIFLTLFLITQIVNLISIGQLSAVNLFIQSIQ